MRLGIKTCGNLMKSICKSVDIEIQDHDIVNHSDHTTPITSLYQAGVLLITSIAITGHKSESSFRIYLRPFDEQKKEALSFLIGTAKNLLLNKWYHFKSSIVPKNGIISKPALSISDDICTPLKSTTQPNLPLHSNAFIKNPTLDG
ncbi:43500_t:CDS:2, partial [Gigaspora margarita]